MTDQPTTAPAITGEQLLAVLARLVSDATPPAIAPAAAAPRDPAPVDVTHRFADLNPEDTIYETHDGYLVKVKTLWDEETISEESKSLFGSQHGREVCNVTGAIVGADGKALRRHCGRHAIHDLKAKHYHHPERFEDPAIGLETAKLRCVADTVRAEKHYQIFRGGYTPGVHAMTAFKARKAAEAAAAQPTPET